VAKLLEEIVHIDHFRKVTGHLTLSRSDQMSVQGLVLLSGIIEAIIRCRNQQNSTPITRPFCHETLQRRPWSARENLSWNTGLTNAASSTLIFAPPAEMSNTEHLLAAKAPSIAIHASWLVLLRGGRDFLPNIVMPLKRAREGIVADPNNSILLVEATDTEQLLTGEMATGANRQKKMHSGSKLSTWPR
jgi:hypothetical protein